MRVRLLRLGVGLSLLTKLSVLVDYLLGVATTARARREALSPDALDATKPLALLTARKWEEALSCRASARRRSRSCVP